MLEALIKRDDVFTAIQQFASQLHHNASRSEKHVDQAIKVANRAGDGPNSDFRGALIYGLPITSDLRPDVGAATIPGNIPLLIAAGLEGCVNFGTSAVGQRAT